MHQPLVSARRLMKCSCGGKVSEEHVIKCKHDPFRSQTHFALQMCVFGMLRHAGILATLEPRHLLPSQASRRQADVMGHGCRLHETSTCAEVGIDVGVVYPDHKLVQSQRCVGTRAHSHCRKKRKCRRTEETLKTRGMKYFPAVVETNGVPSKSCATLIKQIASVAKDQRGHNETYFRLYWTRMIANTVTKAVARAGAGIAKCRLLLSQTSTVGMPFYVESGAFLSPACEGPLAGHAA